MALSENTRTDHARRLGATEEPADRDQLVVVHFQEPNKEAERWVVDQDFNLADGEREVRDFVSMTNHIARIEFMTGQRDRIRRGVIPNPHAKI